jgi:hypothetical protein
MAKPKTRFDRERELTDLLMGPGWKTPIDDEKEKVYINRSLGYIIRVRKRSWEQHNPVIVEWEGGKQDGFKFIPQALEWIKDRGKTAMTDQAKKVAERFAATEKMGAATWYDILGKAQTKFADDVGRELAKAMAPIHVTGKGNAWSIQNERGSARLGLGFKGGSVGEFYFALGSEQLTYSAVNHTPVTLAKLASKDINKALL